MHGENTMNQLGYATKALSDCLPSLIRSQSLVKFVRKRDPRYKRHLETQVTPSTGAIPKTPAQIDEQKASDSYVEQEWQKVDTSRLHGDLEWAVAEGGDLEEWECVVCRKTFRSEAAWNSHERSKKHVKEVEKLKREMEQDDFELNLDHASEDLETEFIDTDGKQLPVITATPELELRHSHGTVELLKDQTIGEPPIALDPKAISGEATGLTGRMDNQTDTFAQQTKREKRLARQAKKAELQDRTEVSSFSEYESTSPIPISASL